MVDADWCYWDSDWGYQERHRQAGAGPNNCRRHWLRRRLLLFPERMSVIFGQNPNDTVPQAYSFWGQPGWWILPTQWFVRVNADGTLTGSPNEDFSTPTYELKTTPDGYMVFQDLMRSKEAGIIR